MVDGSTNDDELDCARNELEKVLSHNDMKDVPLLVLVNKTDKEDTEDLKRVFYFLYFSFQFLFLLIVYVPKHLFIILYLFIHVNS